MTKKSCGVDVSKNNCHACIHLEWIDSDTESGYACNGRDYSSILTEIRHLKKLSSQIYRARTKKCCERKPND